MTQIWRMFTTRSVIFYTLRAPVHVTICLSAALLPHLNFWTICEAKKIEYTWPLIRIAFSTNIPANNRRRKFGSRSIANSLLIYSVALENLEMSEREPFILPP